MQDKPAAEPQLTGSPAELAGQAMALRRQQDWAGALRFWRRLVEISPGSAAWRCSLIESAARIEDFDLVAQHMPLLVAGDTAIQKNILTAANALVDMKAAALAEAALQLASPGLQKVAADYHHVLGRLRVLQGDPAAAMTAFRTCLLTGDPQSRVVRSAGYALAQVAASIGDTVAQEAALRAILAAEPDQAKASQDLARIELARGNAAGARSLLEPVLARGAAGPTAEQLMVRALIGDGAVRLAEELLASLLTKEPERLQWLIELARLKQGQNGGIAAQQAWRKVLTVSPGHLEALRCLSDLLCNDGRIDEALCLWRGQDPRTAEVCLNQARVLERLGHVEAVEAELLTAAALEPQSARVRSHYVQFLKRLERWRDALAQLEHWLAIEPDRPDAAVLRIQLLEQLEETEALEAALSDLHRRHPDNHIALMGLARAHATAGRQEEALQLWRHAAALRPALGDPWHMLVTHLMRLGREAEAFAEFAQAEAALGEGGDGLLTRANILDAAGYPDRAAELYARAIALMPGEAKPSHDFGRSLARDGRLDAALHHLAAARRLDPANAGLAATTAEVAEVLNLLGHDVAALARQACALAPVLVPELLFRHVVTSVGRDSPALEPVPGRIVLANSSLGAGGAERQLVTTIRGLARPGSGVESLALFCRSLDQASARDFHLATLQDANIEVLVPTVEAVAESRTGNAARGDDILLDRLSLVLGPLRFWIDALRRRRPAVVHAWQDTTALGFGLAAVMAGVPRVILSTRTISPDLRGQRSPRWMAAAYRALLTLPTVHLHSNSRAGAASYTNWLGLSPGSVKVIYNGIDFAKLDLDSSVSESRRLKSELGIPAGAPVLGGVFRLAPEKRPLLWGETAGVLAKARPDMHFVVCGDGPLEPDLRCLAESQGFADRLHLTGNQSRIGFWYGLMDVLLLASRHEGLPNVLMEAQGFGVPVVVPEVGGAPEVVENGVTGFVVADADAAKLADRILHCISDLDWRRHAQQRGPTFVRERFGIGAMLRRTLDEYGVVPEVDFLPMSLP